MALSLQMTVIAEGVEHEDQMRVLQTLDCDFIQGFLLSRPSAPKTIEQLLDGPYASQGRSTLGEMSYSPLGVR
jgi:EAL domain-containing protein (putative c-di-GMP-specific phosphodiesterase class I)